MTPQGQKAGEKNCDCHEQKVVPDANNRARNKLLISCVISVLFIIAEVVGGYLANSIAIASDAAHLLADLVSFLINLLAIHVATRQPTKTLSFGWYRAEILGALIAIFLLWMITCVLCYAAIERVIEQDFTVDGTIMLISASLGVVFNIVMMLILHPGGHGHTHTHRNNTEEDNQSQLFNCDKEKLTITSTEINNGDKHASYGGMSNNGFDTPIASGDDIVEKTKKHSHNGNINITASFLHVVGDLLQSIGVLVAAAIIYFKPEWKLADPFCTFVFSAIVICVTVPVLKDICLVLMEGTPHHLNFDHIQESLRNIPDVIDIHDLRIWSLSMDKVVLSAHLVISKSTDARGILRKASCLMRSRYGITETTMQTEEYTINMKDCTHCNIFKA